MYYRVVPDKLGVVKQYRLLDVCFIFMNGKY